MNPVAKQANGIANGRCRHHICRDCFREFPTHQHLGSHRSRCGAIRRVIRFEELFQAVPPAREANKVNNPKPDDVAEDPPAITLISLAPPSSRAVQEPAPRATGSNIGEEHQANNTAGEEKEEAAGDVSLNLTLSLPTGSRT